jgi:hypothetical protein
VLDDGVLDAAAGHAFATGQCHGLALALHEETDWPLVAINSAEGERVHIARRMGC